MNRYLIVEKIGNGKFGYIFKALNKYDQHYYAIKIIEKQELSQEEIQVI